MLTDMLLQPFSAYSPWLSFFHSAELMTNTLDSVDCPLLQSCREDDIRNVDEADQAEGTENYKPVSRTGMVKVDKSKMFGHWQSL